MDTEAARAAYQQSAFARMGIPFERAMESAAVRSILAGAARLNQPKPNTPAAQSATGRR